MFKHISVCSLFICLSIWILWLIVIGFVGSFKIISNFIFFIGFVIELWWGFSLCAVLIHVCYAYFHAASMRLCMWLDIIGRFQDIREWSILRRCIGIGPVSWWVKIWWIHFGLGVLSNRLAESGKAYRWLAILQFLILATMNCSLFIREGLLEWHVREMRQMGLLLGTLCVLKSNRRASLTRYACEIIPKIQWHG